MKIIKNVINLFRKQETEEETTCELLLAFAKRLNATDVKDIHYDTKDTKRFVKHKDNLFCLSEDDKHIVIKVRSEDDLDTAAFLDKSKTNLKFVDNIFYNIARRVKDDMLSYLNSNKDILENNHEPSIK
jgi:hypothetical protein